MFQFVFYYGNFQDYTKIEKILQCTFYSVLTICFQLALFFRLEYFKAKLRHDITLPLNNPISTLKIMIFLNN